MTPEQCTVGAIKSEESVSVSRWQYEGGEGVFGGLQEAFGGRQGGCLPWGKLGGARGAAVARQEAGVGKRV